MEMSHQQPQPLDFDIDGYCYISEDRIGRFFADLALWRQDPINQGEIGTNRRNREFIAPQTHGWFFVSASENINGKSWEDMTDKELQIAIPQWNDVSTLTNDVPEMIDSLFPHRLSHFMEENPARSYKRLLTTWCSVDQSLRPIYGLWTKASHRTQQRWILRLLQILLDPRVTTAPSRSTPLPRLAYEDVPDHLKRSTQMHICLVASWVITYNMEDQGMMWQQMGLREYNPWEKDRKRFPFHRIDTPHALLRFLTKLSRGVGKIAWMAKKYSLNPERLCFAESNELFPASGQEPNADEQVGKKARYV